MCAVSRTSNSEGDFFENNVVTVANVADVDTAVRYSHVTENEETSAVVQTLLWHRAAFLFPSDMQR